MTHLIVLRGNSGSGKTTIANMLHKQIPSSYLISQDVIRREILKESDGPDCQTKIVIPKKVEEVIDESKIVILEGIFRAEWYDEMFAQLSRMFDFVHAYYFELSFEETLKRHQTRKEALEFGEDKMRTWFREKNYLKSLNEIKIDSNTNQETIIQVVLEQCS